MMTVPALLRRIFARAVAVVLTLSLAGAVWFGVPASVHYRVQENYSFEAKNQPAKVRLAVMPPRSGPYQTVKDMAVS